MYKILVSLFTDSSWSRRGTLAMFLMLSCLFACENTPLNVPVGLKRVKSNVPKGTGASEMTSQRSADKDAVAQSSWTYEASSRRDPYESYAQQLRLAPEPAGRRKTALQRIELDELVLVGVMTRLATPRALVEDRTGKGHILKIGTLVGTDSGVVRAIRGEEIVVEERSRIWNGKVVRNLKRIRLQKS